MEERSKIQADKALIREDKKVDKVCNMSKFLKTLSRVSVSILLTLIVFWTSFRHTYNACVIVLM